MENTKADRLRETLYRIFTILYIPAALIIFIVCISSGAPLAAVICGVALIAGWVLLGQRILGFFERIGSSRLTLIFYVLLAAMLVVQFVVANGWSMPHGDREAVFTGAKELADYGYLTDSTPYFLRYAHQRGMLVFLGAFNYALQKLGICATASVYAGVLLTNVCISASLAFAFHAAKRLLGAPRAFAGALLMFTFLPFYTMGLMCYSLTVGTVFIAFALWCYAMASSAKTKRSRILLFCLCGAALALARIISGMGNVAAVAVVIHFLLTCDVKSLLQKLLALLLGFAFITLGFNAAIRYSGVMDFTDEQRELFPMSYWIMVALEGDGYFIDEEYEKMVELGDYELRNEYAVQKIKSTLESMSFSQLVEHQRHKTDIAWAHQNYFGDGQYDESGFSDVRNILMMGVFVLAGVCALFERKPSWSALFMLMVFGYFLFFQFWEVRYENLFTVMPVLCVGAASVDFSALRERLKKTKARESGN